MIGPESKGKKSLLFGLPRPRDGYYVLERDAEIRVSKRFDGYELLPERVVRA